ncbi:unnamed protein product [Amoebophrya sp. A120]|nr:unnamed protein product [Amoebophrya sp. A120]|eukprot:GSA120T00005439001.1
MIASIVSNTSTTKVMAEEGEDGKMRKPHFMLSALAGRKRRKGNGRTSMVEYTPYLRQLPPADYSRFDFLHPGKKELGQMFPSRERELSLAFFRNMFGTLVQRFGDSHGEIPSSHFERAMTRVCRLIGDKDRKIEAARYDVDGSGSVGWWEFVACWKDNRFFYEYSTWERISILFEDPGSSRLARQIQMLLMCTILLSTVLFIIGTLPSMKIWPSDNCQSLCDKDKRVTPFTPEAVGWCEKECEPVATPEFELLEVVCVMVFTFEYVTRIVSCHACRPELIHTNGLLELVLNENCKRKSSAVQRVWQFFINPLNLVDLMAVAPFYIELGLASHLEGGSGVDGSTVLRVIRLTRLFRLLKVARYFHTLNVIVRVVQRAAAGLAVLLFVLMLCVIFSASVLYFAEQGDWDVEQNAYTRYNWVQNTEEQTPFKSIPHSMWWSFVTYTTVGYGDMMPYSVVGQTLAIISMLCSMLSVGMPTSVLLRSFNDVWDEAIQEQVEQRTQTEVEREAVENVFLYSEPFMQMRRVLIEVYDDTLSSQQHDFLGQCMLEFDTIGVPQLKSKGLVQQFVRNSSAVLEASVRSESAKNKNASKSAISSRTATKESSNPSDSNAASAEQQPQVDYDPWTATVELSLDDNPLKPRINTLPITGNITIELTWTPDPDADMVEVAVLNMQGDPTSPGGSDSLTHPPKAATSFAEKEQEDQAQFFEELVLPNKASSAGAENKEGDHEVEVPSLPSMSSASSVEVLPVVVARRDDHDGRAATYHSRRDAEEELSRTLHAHLPARPYEGRHMAVTGGGGKKPEPVSSPTGRNPSSLVTPSNAGSKKYEDQMLALSPGTLSVRVLGVTGISAVREATGEPPGTLTLDPYVTVTVWNRPPKNDDDDESEDEDPNARLVSAEDAFLSVRTKLGEVVTRKRTQTAPDSIVPEFDEILDFKYSWLSQKEEREQRRERSPKGAKESQLSLMQDLTRKITRMEQRLAANDEHAARQRQVSNDH